MSWWQRRNAAKRARELIKGTRKLIRMHRDILQPREIEGLNAAVDAVTAGLSAGDADQIEGSIQKLERQIEITMPRQRHAVWRENVEVFLVAAIVAMGVRTFFFQPFKIPTGSMQPTLYGIVPSVDCERKMSLPARVATGVIRGSWPQRPNSSMLGSLSDFVAWVFWGRSSQETACLFSGDHIFVDRMTYHFCKPKRGDVVVFQTQFMRDRGYDPRGSFYIKRAVAIANDHVELMPPHLLVNGEILDDRPAFKRIYSLADNYHGYTFPDGITAQYLNRTTRVRDVPANSVLAFGDNSRSSLDSRFWGAVPVESIIGRAVFVYWPFTKRFGRID